MFTQTFVYWMFLLPYLSEDLTDKYSLEIFEYHYLDFGSLSKVVVSIYLGYFAILILCAGPIDTKIKSKIPNDQKRPLFHASILTVIIFIMFAVDPDKKDLVIKLLVVWIMTLVQVLPKFFFERTGPSPNE
ncbi:MAG: hypothetical protein NDI69_09165 [Bacteriovoracaceae bacterium]|nr:hypothetical protein [Bacteriovoracaceae bacterium]